MLLINSAVEYFIGIVEDRMDPLKQGRVRVRVFGVHPPQKLQGAVNGIPTEDLGWMSVVQPTNSAAISGIGSGVTGIVEGTKVYGHWLDKYKTNGIVIGTIGSQSLTRPVKGEGFSDPTGQFPRYIGSDTNPLVEGSTAGDDYITNVVQDNNLDIGINPDDTDLSDIPEDPNPAYTIEEMLRRDEGLRVKVYWDVKGYSVGIGHFIGEFSKGDMAGANALLSKQVGREVTGNPGNISVEEASMLFKKDLDKVQTDIVRNAKTGPVYVKMNRSRQMALENMAFQLGIGGLAKFEAMLAAMFVGNWKTAFNEARNSTWYNQTKGRASRVSMIILVGNMESYGIIAPGRAPKTLSAMAVRAAESSDPADPWVPTDSRILFKEPESSYEGQYPYVQTMETEGGHIQEFDNTPGYERYRLFHPTGSYVEVAPDGRRTTKTMADDYFMIQGDGNKLVSGDALTNIGGDEVYYNMGNLRRQTDGSENIYIRGDETKTVEGDGTLIVQGNVKILVQGNAEIHVEGNCETTVDGNYEMKVAGNLTWTIGGSVIQNVTGSWVQTMQSMSSKAAGQYTVDGSRIDIG